MPVIFVRHCEHAWLFSETAAASTIDYLCVTLNAVSAEMQIFFWKGEQLQGYIPNPAFFNAY